MYLSVKQKLFISIIVAGAWVAFSLNFAVPWIDNLGTQIHPLLAWLVVVGIAIIPGFSMAFIIPSLIFDKRPTYKIPEVLPDISILIAAYNEETVIADTFESIYNQQYPGHVTVYLVDDGSTDKTIEVADAWRKTHKDPNFHINVLKMPQNSGKAAALNTGLKFIDTDYVITLDADTSLYKDALAHLVTNIVEGPDKTAAVAGSVLARNSRKNTLCRLQEWDYFLGIAVVKRTQSLFQGTLVAQGAFSVYSRRALIEAGGWDEQSVGEDIVLTWAFRDFGYRVGHCEKAFAFTNVPETYKQFFKQRERWSRGLIEAFRKHPKVITRFKLNSPFIFMNFTFPFTDLMYLLGFIPGLIAAVFFHWYGIVGVMTLMLVPLALIMNWIMYVKQKNIFIENDLTVRRHFMALFIYMFTYQLVMIPATVVGYWREVFKLGSKKWGTK